MSNKVFIIIDGSYYCFYRFHSLTNWWKNAFPENLDVLENPINNPVFVEKFVKLFKENIETNIVKKLKLHKNSVKPIILVGKDCPRNDIWRKKIFDDYKANRNYDGFTGAPFFKMVHNKENNLFLQSGAQQILSHPYLEADDCIALTTSSLLVKYPDCQIYIITSDRDYLQISSDRVHLYDLAFKNLAEKKSSTGDPVCDLFCKIVMGDTSDNIPSVFPKCGPKTALKYYLDKELFLKKLEEKQDYKKQYEMNKKLVDFNMIPDDLANEFLETIDNL